MSGSLFIPVCRDYLSSKAAGVFRMISHPRPSARAGRSWSSKDNVIDASGCYVVPGLIDHHAHVQPLAKIGLPTEASCFASGVTAVVDAGSTGCANYIYHQGILERLRVNVQAYLNVCTTGLDSLPGGPGAGRVL